MKASALAEYPLNCMKAPGAYKIAHRRTARIPGVVDAGLDPLPLGDYKLQRLLDSLRSEIIEGGGGDNLRIRQIFWSPREIYRLELELPELGYHRTTLLDRDALEELLATDDLRDVIASSKLGDGEGSAAL
ncbi:hypothetical protein MK489_21250 [Myxococcota bacterium]|nr:hypothetical protein [Myxococcota bacterium]